MLQNCEISADYWKTPKFMQKLWRWFQKDIQQNDGFLYSKKLINDIILKRELLFPFSPALCSLFHWIFYVTAFWIKIQVKTPINTPPKTQPQRLIKSKIGFHLTLLLSVQDCICILYFSQQIMQISVCSSPLESWWREELLQLSIVLPHGGNATSTFLLRRWVLSDFLPHYFLFTLIIIFVGGNYSLLSFCFPFPQ